MFYKSVYYVQKTLLIIIPIIYSLANKKTLAFTLQIVLTYIITVFLFLCQRRYRNLINILGILFIVYENNKDNDRKDATNLC